MPRSLRVVGVISLTLSLFMLADPNRRTNEAP